MDKLDQTVVFSVFLFFYMLDKKIFKFNSFQLFFHGREYTNVKEADRLRVNFNIHVHIRLCVNTMFLAPLAVGQRAYVMVCCPSCVRASVRPLTFSLNIFFSETTYRILMKFLRNFPAMVLFRIFRKNLIPSKTVVVMATKLKKI